MLCHQAWSAEVRQPAAPCVMAAATSLTSKLSENACDDSLRMCFCSHQASTVRYVSPSAVCLLTRYTTSSAALTLPTDSKVIRIAGMQLFAFLSRQQLCNRATVCRHRYLAAAAEACQQRGTRAGQPPQLAQILEATAWSSCWTAQLINVGLCSAGHTAALQYFWTCISCTWYSTPAAFSRFCMPHASATASTPWSKHHRQGGTS